MRKLPPTILGYEHDVIDFLDESNAIEGVYDIKSLEQAVFAWRFLREQEKMSPHVILKTHKILMLHQPLYPNEKGYFREVPVYIGGREAMPQHLIWEAIRQWCEEVNTDILGMRRLWKQRHVEYETIHPFVDGNGRTGRMFMNWQRIRQGLPILVIKSDERHKYYEWFK